MLLHVLALGKGKNKDKVDQDPENLMDSYWHEGGKGPGKEVGACKVGSSLLRECSYIFVSLLWDEIRRMCFSVVC